MTNKCKQCNDRIGNEKEEFCSLECRVRWYGNQNTEKVANSDE